MSWFIERFNSSKLTEKSDETSVIPVTNEAESTIPEVEGEAPTEEAPDPAPVRKKRAKRTKESQWPLI